ncbi:MAG: choice-of-anchor D domain-containing protein [Planctomycetota bacterium]
MNSSIRLSIRLAALAAVAVVATAATAAPTPSYTVSSQNTAFQSTPLVNPVVLYLAQDAISSEQQPSGFDFTFFGTSYDRFRVGNNGYITLGNASTAPSTIATDAPDVATDGLVIAPLWLNYTDSQVQYVYSASAKRLVIRWGRVRQSAPSHGAPSFGNPPMTPAPGWVLFELMLYTAGHAREGEIDFRYGSGGNPKPYACVDYNSVCIASAAGTSQEVINGTVTGLVGSNGEMDMYPLDTLITFVPVVSSGTTMQVTADSSPVSYASSAAGTTRDFGSIDINNGATANVTFKLVNTGSTNLTLTGVSITGSDAGEFVLDTTMMQMTVAPAGVTQFSVAFDPTTVGAKSAQVEIAHDASNEPDPFVCEIVGMGTTPALVPIIEVREGGASGALISNGAGAGGQRDFGTVDLGLLPFGPVTIYVANTGTGALNLGTVATSDPSFTINGALPPSLAPGASTTFEIYFTATAVGSYSATVSFAHDDTSTTTPFEFGLSGTADQQGVTSPPATGGSAGGCVATPGATWAAILMFGLLAVGARRRKMLG